MRVAAIDLGSNSFHMLIANIAGDSFEPLLRERMTIQLGNAALSTGRLDEIAFERGMHCMEEFKRLAMSRQVEHTIAVATSAIREAENGEEFIHQVGKRTGIAIRAIPGREEARLIYLAVRKKVDLQSRKALLIDIGGGSVELTVADSNKIHFCTSQKLGFLRLHNKFITADPISEQDRKRLEDHLGSTLAGPKSIIARFRPELAIATSGTATTLLRIVQRRQNDRENRDVVRSENVTSIMKTAMKLGLQDRATEFDLDPSRATYFPTALLCLNSILNGIGLEEFSVSPYSLREGLVYDFIERNRTALKARDAAPGDPAYHSVLNLATRCGYPEGHSHHVARIANQIFLQTKPIHGLGDKEERILKHASLLHDIGYHISYNKHHKHGAYLIMNCELSGCSQEERLILANLARYHRGTKPKSSHEYFAALPKGSQQIVKYLASILHIADSLDRSHSQLAERVECVRDGDTIEFRVLFRTYEPGMYLDLHSAKRRGRYFEKLFGLDTRFVTLGVQTPKARQRIASGTHKSVVNM